MLNTLSFGSKWKGLLFENPPLRIGPKTPPLAADDGREGLEEEQVVAKEDLRLKLRDILAGLQARDSVLPDRPALPRVPLVLLSGFNTVQTSATVRALRSLNLRGGVDQSTSPMFAVAVPKALDKTLRVLIEEIEGDHLELKASQPPPTSG